MEKGGRDRRKLKPIQCTFSFANFLTKADCGPEVPKFERSSKFDSGIELRSVKKDHLLLPVLRLKTLRKPTDFMVFRRFS